MLAALGACTAPGDINTAPPDLGDFALGQTVVVAAKLAKGPFSREASRDAWIASVKPAVDERLMRHQGQRAYNLGIALEGYVLAKAGIPVVAAPKSVLIVAVTVWDDAAQAKLNDLPKRFTVVEDFSGDTVLGSGNTQTSEVQMANLSRNAAKIIEQWLLEQKREEGWFAAPSPRAEATSAPLSALQPVAPPATAPAAAPSGRTQPRSISVTPLPAADRQQQQPDG